MSEKEKVAVIGDGSYGTAVALVLHSSGRRTAIWGYDPEYLDVMRRTRENDRYLPGIPLPEGIDFVDDLPEIMRWADLIVTAMPSKFMRPVLSGAHGAGADKLVLSLTKGLDAVTLQRPSEVVAECLGTNRVVALSGPSHAEEVARGLPASVVVAAEELEAARQAQQIVSTPHFRAYATRDIIGVEVAGALKNVIALAAGLLQGMEMGDSALAALVTRGLAEITRLGVAMGAEPSTFSGLAGLGDLILTCVSPHGRNRRVGMMLAEGKSVQEILESSNSVPESITTTTLAVELARKHGILMPMTEQVAEILLKGKDPRLALEELMTRARKDED